MMLAKPVVKDTKPSRLNISASEYKEVVEDVLIASLRFEYEGENAKAVQRKVNQIMTRALKIANIIPGIQVSTDQYYVYRHDTPDPKDPEAKPVWKATQALSISGKSPQDVLELSKQFQDMGLVMNSMNFVLSPEKIEEARNSLMEVTMRKLTDKAKIAAKFIGKSDVEIAEINIDADNLSSRQQNFGAPVLSAANYSNDEEKDSIPIALPKRRKIVTTISATFLLR
jgi:predicted secreted protein